MQNQMYCTVTRDEQEQFSKRVQHLLVQPLTYALHPLIINTGT